MCWLCAGMAACGYGLLWCPASCCFCPTRPDPNPARLPPSPRLQGCCTENARKNGGLLIDLEINTARRFWGDKKVRGLAGIQFQILDD